MEEETIEEQNQTLRLPGGRTVPAIVVPIALSLAFAAWKTYEHRWPEPPPSDSAWKRKGDAESLDNESQDGTSYQEILVVVMLGILMVSTMACVILPWRPRWLFMSVLGYHLFITGTLCFIHSDSKPGDIRPLVAVTAAASLMLILAVTLPWPQWPISWTLLAGAIALLGWPPLPNDSSDLGGLLSLQSTCLLMLLIQLHIPQRFLPDEKGTDIITSKWVLNLCFSPLLLHILWQAVCVWSGLEKDPWPLRRGLGVKRKILLDLVYAVCWLVDMIVMIGAFQGGTWVTTFATSCVPFSNNVVKALFRRRSDSANMAGTAFMGLCCYYLLSRAFPKTVRQFLSILINAAGWPISAVLSLGLLMMPVDRLLGIQGGKAESQPLL